VKKYFLDNPACDKKWVCFCWRKKRCSDSSPGLALLLQTSRVFSAATIKNNYKNLQTLSASVANFTVLS